MRFTEVFCWILVIQLVLWHLSSTCHNQLEVIILKCAQNISWLAEKGSSVWSFLHLQEQFLQTIYNYLTFVQLNPFYSRSCLWGTYWNSHVLHTGYLSTHGSVINSAYQLTCAQPRLFRGISRSGWDSHPYSFCKAHIFFWKKLGVWLPCHGSLHCSKSVHQLIFVGYSWGEPRSPRKLRTKQIQCVHRQSLITSYSTTVTIISFLYQNHSCNIYFYLN